MNATLPTMTLTATTYLKVEPEQFKAHFQRVFISCVNKGFSPEECFAFIWEETLEICPLTPHQQKIVYESLKDWIKDI